ncbi:hypothetical protein [Salinibacter sp.]|uniref:hypothetical protein n=1 Tax=Salinibacter sp. TaxID=2065818 RepID=UPI0021E89866|nr:hypothetical protein [Salinibacter sp.]
MSRRQVVLAVAGIAIFLVAVLSYVCDGGFEIGLNLVRTISALGTFLVAYYLFDRFGLDKEIKSRQMSSVLELADAMREVTIMANSSNAGYFLSFRSDQLKHSSDAPHFEEDKSKKIYADFIEMERGLHSVLSFREDMMIPNEIKSQLKKLEPVGRAPLEELNGEKDLILLRFDGKRGDGQEMGLFVPPTTLEEYCGKLESVTEAVQDWVQENSQVSVDIEQ